MGTVYSITTGEIMSTDEKKQVLRRELFWCAVALGVFAVVYLLLEDRPMRDVTPAAAVPSPKPKGKHVPAPVAAAEITPEVPV